MEGKTKPTSFCDGGSGVEKKTSEWKVEKKRKSKNKKKRI